MELLHFHMSDQTFVLINGPMTVLNFAANIFFAWCLIFPPRGRPTLRQPLKMLLAFIAFCSLAYCAILPVTYFLEEHQSKELFITTTVLIYVMHNSMTCSVWLNLLCYVQIVPVRRAFWAWVKRNVRPLIHASLLLDQMVLLFKSAVETEQFRCAFAFTGRNITMCECMSRLAVIKVVSSYFFRGYVMACLCVTSVCSLSTARYLWGHMRNMARSCNPSGQRRLRGQMRVTASGMAQGVFYFLYGIFYLMVSLTSAKNVRDIFSYWILFTISTFYTTSTTLNLAVGQAVFRERIADSWTAISALCAVVTVTINGRLTSADMGDTVPVGV